MSLPVITAAGLIAVVVLIVWFFKRHESDQLEALLTKRRDASKLVDRADYVEGNQHIPVALALSASEITYENGELEGKLDLSNLDEVEYDDELSTGKEVTDGRVLRLRSHGRVFEFILAKDRAAAWTTTLPSHRADEPGNVHSV